MCCTGVSAQRSDKAPAVVDAVIVVSVIGWLYGAHAKIQSDHRDNGDTDKGGAPAKGAW